MSVLFKVSVSKCFTVQHFEYGVSLLKLNIRPLVMTLLPQNPHNMFGVPQTMPQLLGVEETGAGSSD